MTKACGSSVYGSHTRSLARARFGESTLIGADALRTSDAVEFGVHVFTDSDASAARAFFRRGVRRHDRRATRRCATDFRSAGYIDAELEASAGGSARSGSGRSDAGQQRTRGHVRRISALADAEV